MIHITDNESAAQAKYAIELALLGDATWQLADGQALRVTLERGSYEFSVEWGKLIFAWWDDERSQSWNVTDYEIDAVELRLRAVRGLGRETATFTLRDPAQIRQQLDALPTAQRRSSYAAALTNLMVSQISGLRVQRVNARGSRASAGAGPYARLVLNVGGEVVLALGADAGEAQAEIESVVAAGITWLAGFNERRTGSQQARQLWLCVPRGRSHTVVERLTFIDVTHLGARAACFEVAQGCAEMIAVRPATQGELLNAHPRELRWPRETAATGRWRERILNLAPHLIEAREWLNGEAESYSIHGLEFARACGHERARVSFGVMNWPPESANQRHLISAHGKQMEPRPPTRLNETNFTELERLVREIALHRCANSPDRRHPFYRLRAEAWLESLLRRHIHALDVTLDERCVYSQIPTWRADERSVIDLLAVNHQGRLVVIEIKAAEDPDLPLQGLDYWLRVEQARGRGEFERRGLFPGRTLAAQPPLLYLAAPRLRFHRTFSTVARCLAPQVEAYRLGLNTDWRAGVRVHTRERVN